MQNQWHSAQKLSKFSDKQQEIIDFQLKNDLLTQFTRCVSIQTPLSCKPMSAFCSPETEKLNEKILDELSLLDDIQISNNNLQLYYADDQQQYLVQTIQFEDQMKMKQAIQNYNSLHSELFLPINEIKFVNINSGFCHLKIFTKRFYELNNFNNTKEFVRFCLKIIQNNVLVQYNHIIQQLDGQLYLNPYCLFIQSDAKSSISETIDFLLKQKRISQEFEIFYTLIDLYEKYHLDKLIQTEVKDTQCHFFKQTLLNKLLKKLL